VWNFPTGQSWQESTDKDPGCGLKVPLLQGVQSCTPLNVDLLLNVPEGQFWQPDVESLLNSKCSPWGQSEYFPGGHRIKTISQGPPPISLLYFPASHSVQTLPSAPVEPALHTQSTSSLLAAGELEFDGHSKHFEFPIKFLYVPAGQTIQSYFTNKTFILRSTTYSGIITIITITTNSVSCSVFIFSSGCFTCINILFWVNTRCIVKMNIYLLHDFQYYMAIIFVLLLNMV